jgi:hypothetical protein
MNTIQKRIEEAATFLFKQRGLDKESCRQAMGYILSNQWISVEEALPEVNELVFGCVNDEGTPQAVGMAYYDEYGGWHYSDEEEISLITHWMPIPQLKGDKE